MACFYFYDDGAGETLALVLLGVVVLEADLDNLLLLGVALKHVVDALVDLIWSQNTIEMGTSENTAKS